MIYIGDEMKINKEPDETITLPFPPSINGYWRSIVQGGRPRQIISAKGRSFREQALTMLIDQGKYGKGLDGRLAVKLTLCPPTRRKYDVDNFSKATLDVLTLVGFWEDDEQVDKLVVVKSDICKGGKTVVHVWKLNEVVK